MTRKWIVLGDSTSGGGKVVTASQFTFIDNKGVARVGDKATCPLHKGVFPIVDGDPTHSVDGASLALHGSKLACGCTVLATQQQRLHSEHDSGGTQPLGSSTAAPGKQDRAPGLQSSLGGANLAPEPFRGGADPAREDCETRFRRVSRVVLANEGGFVDDPDDAGGATNRGIAWSTWQQYAMVDLGVEPTLGNLKSLSEAQAEIIYRKRYWEPRGFCRINNPRTALMIYDWTITSGKAIREVQEVLSGEFGARIRADNHMGQATIDAINEVADQGQLISAIAAARKEYYRSLTYNSDGSRNANSKFLNGWIARVDRCLEIGE